MKNNKKEEKMDDEILMKEVFADCWKIAKQFLSDKNWESYLSKADEIVTKHSSKSKKQELLARMVITGQTYYFEQMLKGD